jgi:uncharacterized protein (TIGR02246 family)
MDRNDAQQVTALLNRYQDALNASSVDRCLELYTPDGVFMPQHSPSSVGVVAVRTAYEKVFEAIKLSVEFKIAEVKVVTSEWAFARTNSSGTTLERATGQTRAEANQELFVFQKLAGTWKIARYCFSTTNPPR